MPPALGYKKSHNGCLSCKQRRVKCDESRPCTACIRHGIPCSLIQTPLLNSLPPAIPQQSYPSKTSSIIASSPQRTLSRARSSRRRSSSYLLKSLKPKGNIGRDASLSTPGSGPNSSGHRRQISTLDPFPYFAKFISHQISRPFDLGIDSWKSDLELIHHWSTQTYLTLPRSKEVGNVWQVQVPRMALEYQYLMHQILSIAAYHLASLHADRRQLYLLEASQHQNHAIKGMKTALAEIVADNCHALFAASALLVFGGHAAITIHSEGRGPVVEDILDIFLLVRGVHSVLGTSERFLEKGPFKELFNLPQNPPPLQSVEVQAVVNQLTTLQAQIMIRNLDGDLTSRVQAGILTLVKCIFSAAATTEIPDMRIVTTWPTSLDADFIAILRRGHPAALALLAYFCVILRSTEAKFWYVKGWGSGVMASIADRIEPSWKDLIEWPLQHISRMDSESATWLP